MNVNVKLVFQKLKTNALNAKRVILDFKLMKSVVFVLSTRYMLDRNVYVLKEHSLFLVSVKKLVFKGKFLIILVIAIIVPLINK